MILADTSVWVGHLRSPDRQLQESLLRGQIVMHPLVMGELACGNLPRRTHILTLLGRLPSLPQATDSDAFHLLESRKLWGKGLGWIDVHLLASALISGARLWTLDARLHKTAFAAGIA